MPSDRISSSSFRKKLLLIVGILVILVLVVGVSLVALCKTCFSNKGAVPNWKGYGTTRNFRDIIFGRCYDYLKKNPSTGLKDCDAIWQELTNAVNKKDQCNIKEEHYKRLVEMAAETIPCNKSLLWSKTNDLVHHFTKASANYITLEDTFLGYLFNGLLWCGMSCCSGMDLNSCPAWNECKYNSMSSFWKMASAAFARSSCGVVNVMLNGSADGAIYRNDRLSTRLSNANRVSVLEACKLILPSILRIIEVPNLNPRMVSEVRVWVIDDIDGPKRYSCDSESLLELKYYIEKHNLTYSCITNYRPVQLLQCLETPESPACNVCSKS